MIKNTVVYFISQWISIYKKYPFIAKLLKSREKKSIDHYSFRNQLATLLVKYLCFSSHYAREPSNSACLLFTEHSDLYPISPWQLTSPTVIYTSAQEPDSHALENPSVLGWGNACKTMFFLRFSSLYFLHASFFLILYLSLLPFLLLPPLLLLHLLIFYLLLCFSSPHLAPSPLTELVIRDGPSISNQLDRRWTIISPLRPSYKRLVHHAA